MAQYSLDAYKALLRNYLDEGRTIYPLTNAIHAFPQSGDILLRHDVDYSVELAVEMAEVNAELGISGTFCLQLRAGLYNLADEYSQRAVVRLRALGQTIGLHFMLPDDVVDHEVPSLASVRERARHDARLLQEIIGGDAEMVLSWHNPSVLGSRFDDLVASSMPSLLNANWLTANGVKYISDANHRHSVESWLNSVRAEQGPIQALFHPLQWVIGGDTMEETLAGTWAHIFRQSERTYLTNHVYRNHFPSGLPEELLAGVRDAIAGAKKP